MKFYIIILSKGHDTITIHYAAEC